MDQINYKRKQVMLKGNNKGKWKIKHMGYKK